MFTTVTADTLTDKDIAAFWRKVDQSAGHDGCHPWIGASSSGGYGLFDRRYKGLRAWRVHRLAYELAVGPIPEGLMLRHACDNPPCCNPRHLIPGTAADNSRDMVERGRHWTTVRPDRIPRGDNHWTRKRGTSAFPRGTQHHNAKLTVGAATDIRRRCAAGETQRAVAALHGVSQGTVWQVLRGRWS